jgi:hypothetical protein
VAAPPARALRDTMRPSSSSSNAAKVLSAAASPHTSPTSALKGEHGRGGRGGEGGGSWVWSLIADPIGDRVIGACGSDVVVWKWMTGERELVVSRAHTLHVMQALSTAAVVDTLSA